MAPLSVLPGRLRLECETIKGERDLCEALELRIGALPGVLASTANFRTGRVLIQFEETAISRAELTVRIDTLLGDPALCCEIPEKLPTRPKGHPGPSPTSGKNLLLDIVAHAVLPRPFDILVPALSALRR